MRCLKGEVVMMCLGGAVRCLGSGEVFSMTVRWFGGGTGRYWRVDEVFEG